MSHIKLVIFDGRGVLYPANMVGGDAMRDALGLTDEQVVEIYQTIYKTLSIGGLTEQEFWQKVADTYHVRVASPDEKLLTGSFEAQLKPMPGVRDIITKLQQNGVQLAFLSDTTPLHSPIFKKHGFYDHFDRVFLSWQEKVKKPDPKAYQNVLGYYHVEPSQALMIDDELKNIEGARSLGLKGLVFENAGQLELALHTFGLL